MKRLVEIEVESCTKCPKLEYIDGFSCHSFICPFKGQSSLVEDPVSRSTVEREMEIWFENCPLWCEI